MQTKPRLLNQGQGFSVLNVEHNGRLLYSKYAPEKSIGRVIDSLTILPGTMVFLFSPVLFYGLSSLKKKLPKDCTLCAVELDDSLYTFTKDYLQTNKIELDFPFFSSGDLESLDGFIRTSCQSGKTRRPLFVFMSAGSDAIKSFYEKVQNAATEIISSHWKNRVTLQKMGKLYNRNLIRNIVLAEEDSILEQHEGCVNKSIIVCGAGESLCQIAELKEQIQKKDFFIIAADAAVKTLFSLGIKPDAVVMQESQHAVTDFFTGCDIKDCVLICDATCRTEAALLFKKRIWFFTEYEKTFFLDDVFSQKIFSKKYSPMGSVGLTAVQAALKLRKNDDIPVYVLGLDFSFSAGKTHANYSMQHQRLLQKTSRLTGLENFDPSFSNLSCGVKSKNGSSLFSTKILCSYRDLFKTFFSDKKNIFDAAKNGLDLGLKNKEPKAVLKDKEQNFFKFDFKMHKAQKAKEFLNSIKTDLKKAVSLLECGSSSPYFDKKSELSLQIKNLLERKDFLYIHFPDGMAFSMEENFLKRVKAEAVWFLKQISVAQNFIKD